MTMHTLPDDPDPTRSSRRKACDLCFTKKIKCDMLKPVCSNCKLYGSDCRTSITRKKPNPAGIRRQREEETNRVEGLENRLARIEDQLQQVLDAARDARSSNAARVPSQLQSIPPSSEVLQVGGQLGHETNYNSLQLDDAAVSEWRFDPIEPCLYDGPSPEPLTLPPLEEVLPVVDYYFVVYNAAMPLFHQPTFMKLLKGWYTQHSRDKATWAAVQIVMALGYRTPRIGASETAPMQIQKANQCLRNAQAAVSELVTREEDLLGIQILLGIVMLFQNSRDQKPASIIIGMAIRLAHRLHLHSNDSTKYFTPEEAEQRLRVFWIAYTLDKDICLRARTPSAQLDDDIDVALPPMTPTDGIGLLWTEDGQRHFNYFRLRIELSHIEGRVYDLLYSNRATKVTGQERQRRVERLQAQLDQWYGRIPSVFQIDHVASTVGPGQLIQMTKMHHAYLLAEVMTHGVYSRDADWVTRISSFSRAAMQEISTKFTSHASPTCYKDQHPPLPAGWNKCVEISRGCMKLFQEATPTECLIWQCSCAHFSALIILLANLFIHPSHPFVSLDQHLAARAINLFDRLLELVDSEAFQTLRAIVGELHSKATAAVEEEKKRAQASNSVFDGLSPGMGPLQTVEQPDFLPLSDDMDGLGNPFAAVDEPRGFATPDFAHLQSPQNVPDELQPVDFNFMG